MTTTLFLTSTATSAPRPTTSLTLSKTASASETTLGPGRFNTAVPGNTRAGQYNPSSPLANSTNAAEIDNTGSTPGTTRQGWLWDQDLTGYTLPSGTWGGQLKLVELLAGATTVARAFVRITVVIASGGVWTTTANLLTTNILGESSHSSGQAGWTAQDAGISVPTTAANRTTNWATSSTPWTFSSGERLFVEFGFGNAGSATARTWGLFYNAANSFITLPDPFLDVQTGTDTVGLTDVLALEATYWRLSSDVLDLTDEVTAQIVSPVIMGGPGSVRAGVGRSSTNTAGISASSVRVGIGRAASTRTGVLK